MKKQSLFQARSLTILIALFVLATNCQKNTTGPSTAGQMVSIYLTDDPSMTFDNLFIDIQKVEIKMEDNSEDELSHRNGGGTEDATGHHQGGWIDLHSSTGVFDLLAFKNGIDTLFANASISSATAPRKIRLTLGNNNKGVLNGSVFPLQLIKNQVELDLDKGMIEAQEGRIKIWLDFDANLSVRKHGNEFELLPNIKAFTKENTGSIEGKIVPRGVRAIVMAINGADTATAKPEREGEFKIIGLKSGNYKLIIHATEGNYKDANINNITVRKKEDSHVGSIELRP